MDNGPLEFTVTPHPNPVSAERLAEIHANPQFGKLFSDHMVDLLWTPAEGWHRGRVQPYGPIPLDPAAAVLHYGQEIFEGIKAYRHPDGSIHTFRPQENGLRLQRSAARMAMPELPVEVFLQSLREFIAADGRWVPSGSDQTLYLRPFMFASEAFIGMRAAKEVAYYLIATPGGPYFGPGMQHVSIWLSEKYVRAASNGGTGAAKTGGNYAASLLPQLEATANGCDQTVFLDGAGNVEEFGGMNIIFVHKDGTLVTPESESILPGITRDSILQIATDRGHRVERRTVPFSQWREGVASGDITEVFACGTAALVAPVGLLKGEGFEDRQPLGDLAISLRDELTDIQYGRREDRHGWMYRLDA